MNRSKQAGMGKKAIVVLLVGLALASVHPAEAQQAKKVPRIGYLTAARLFRLSPPASRRFAKGCVSLVTSRGKTLPLSIDMRMKN